MSKKIAALILLAACGLSSAQAAPGQDEIEKFLLQNGLTTRLGDTIHEATDRAAKLISNAMDAIGVRYRLGGTSAETGFDCSGLVLTVFQQSLGLKLPRTAAEQAAATTRIEKADLKPGDLVFFNTLRRAYSHVGIYLGDGHGHIDARGVGGGFGIFHGRHIPKAAGAAALKLAFAGDKQA